MTDALRAGTGHFVRRTCAPGRAGTHLGIVWLDRVSLVEARRAHPAYGPSATVLGSADASRRGQGHTVGATVEVPTGYLVVDVRVGYATAAQSFVGELRVADLGGSPKSALVALERKDEDHQSEAERGDEVATVFVDGGTVVSSPRTCLSIRASVVDGTDHVAVRGLSLQLTRA
ncbi:MAG TPA: hypothetical protein VG455_06830 [Acidimicrobiales bacterium]|nr:hypothetical protein [Acidimicrobiales bacterium]